MMKPSSLESNTRRVIGSISLPSADCPPQISIQPGVYVNPCSILSGQPPAPVITPVDPRFYPYSDIWHHNCVDYSECGSVDDWLGRSLSDPTWPPRRFTGECASGSAWASRSHYQPFRAVGDPVRTYAVPGNPTCTPRSTSPTFEVKP